jgi:hypothetical protein
LIPNAKQLDFDSAIRRFESSRPSQLVLLHGDFDGLNPGSK